MGTWTLQAENVVLLILVVVVLVVNIRFRRTIPQQVRDVATDIDDRAIQRYERYFARQTMIYDKLFDMAPDHEGQVVRNQQFED